ncbi:MAG: AlpA family phage regulatory protein [Proteobacteria bacterium]|nr:AlpA family phage regulatory protein [Pseudomonadota bacterium]
MESQNSISASTRQQDQPQRRRIIRAVDACAILGISKSHWYSGVREGIFPQPVTITQGRKGWIEDELYALVDRLVAARGQV